MLVSFGLQKQGGSLVNEGYKRPAILARRGKPLAAYSKSFSAHRIFSKHAIPCPVLRCSTLCCRSSVLERWTRFTRFTCRPSAYCEEDRAQLPSLQHMGSRGCVLLC